MSRIKMKTASQPTMEQLFEPFLAAAAARGAREKTLATYAQHFKAISKRLDISFKTSEMTQQHLDNMIFTMRKEGLSPQSINSYTRTMKVFLSWCNAQGYTALNIAIYKAPETVKETYTDEELLRLLKKPASTCKFCEFRNWSIVCFVLNSGCRAATVRNIQNKDVDLAHGQVAFRHTKNGKAQVIPLCQSMVAILREYMSVRGGGAEDYLFCDEFGGFLTENALRQAIANYNRRRGVEKTSLHCFRHTFARKYLLDCGGNAFTFQKLLGHSTLNMTRHYCSIFNSDLAKNY